MRAFVLAFSILLILSSCTSRQGKEGQIDVSKEERPSMLLQDATYVFSSSSVSPLILKAQSITIDDKSKIAILDGCSFSQEDSGGTLILEGKADHVEVNTDTNDAKLSGNIRISQIENGFAIQAEEITWKNEEEILESGPEAVTVTFDKKNTITATGFYGKVGEGTYEFSRILSGRVEE